MGSLSLFWLFPTWWCFGIPKFFDIKYHLSLSSLTTTPSNNSLPSYSPVSWLCSQAEEAAVVVIIIVIVVALYCNFIVRTNGSRCCCCCCSFSFVSFAEDEQ